MDRLRSCWQQVRHMVLALHMGLEMVLHMVQEREQRHSKQQVQQHHCKPSCVHATEPASLPFWLLVHKDRKLVQVLARKLLRQGRCRKPCVHEDG
jgi:hypothetical protein